MRRGFSFALGRGFRRGSSAVVGVGAGLLLRTLARVVCWQRSFVRTRDFLGGVLPAVVGVSARLLLLTLVRVRSH
jgi:hypothetical protein